MSNIISKLKIVLLICFIAMGIALFFSIKSCRQYKEDASRLSSNQEALLTEMQEYKSKDGKNVVKTQELQLTTKELQTNCSTQVNTIKQMGISTKRVNSISTTATETRIDTVVQLKDTVIYVRKDSIITPETVKQFNWSDNWNKIEGTINGDKVSCTYQGTDTLNMVVSRVPKKFLFFKWGTKRIDVDIMNANPYNKITYNQTITIKK